MKKYTDVIDVGIVAMMLVYMLLTSCVSLAPISVAWRSNSNQQYATTDATNDNDEVSPAVNADKKTETQAAVSTSSGEASVTPKEVEK